ncbi:MAG: hypothetical protein K2Y37_26590 [Pirellulales bacterium]|nr:hypothetical protein [Pirellulales bacterium]
MRRLHWLFAARDNPEAALKWSQDRWRSWFANATYLYFHSTDVARRRAAFAPFAVEPLSEAGPAPQLHFELKRYAIDALENFMAALNDQFERWRAEDGEEIADFCLKLYDLFGFLVAASVWEQQAATFVAKLGPPLSDKVTLRLLDSVVRATIGRSNASALLRIGAMIARKSETLNTWPWRAQIRIFEGILELEGARDMLENVEVALPNIGEIIRHTPAKHLLADVVVEQLGLREVAKLHDLQPKARQDQILLAHLKVAIFPGRVEFWGEEAVDRLTGERAVCPPLRPHAALDERKRLFDFAHE